MKTIEQRAREIACALGRLQDEARAFTTMTANGQRSSSYATGLLADCAVEFTEAVRRAIDSGRRRRK